MPGEAPTHDYAALGARQIARSPCGNYGEETLVAWHLPTGEVVLEIGARRWLVEPGDVLRVNQGGFFGQGGVIGQDSDLDFVDPTGRVIGITHFEIDSMWGGVMGTEVVALARKIAALAGCSVWVLEAPQEPG